jgi:hypothetical protein
MPAAYPAARTRATSHVLLAGNSRDSARLRDEPDAQRALLAPPIAARRRAPHCPQRTWTAAMRHAPTCRRQRDGPRTTSPREVSPLYEWAAHREHQCVCVAVLFQKAAARAAGAWGSPGCECRCDDRADSGAATSVHSRIPLTDFCDARCVRSASTLPIGGFRHPAARCSELHALLQIDPMQALAARSWSHVERL